MKVKIKENINLADLKEDRWNGCKYDTMLLLQKYYDEGNKTFEVKEMSPMENYIIVIEDKDWIVNPKVFEIIEEDKKIEKIDMFDYFTGYDFDNTSIDLRKHLEVNFQTLNNKINEIIDYLEEKDNE